AARRLASMAIAAAALATVGLLAAPPSTLLVAGLAAVPALGVVGFAWCRREHSLAGELIAAVALPGAAAVTVVASGLAWQPALAVWGAWAVGYAASVVAVHRVLGQRWHRNAPGSELRLAVALAVIAVVAVSGVTLASAAASVAIPLVAISTSLILRPPRPTRLRAIGVALVVASVVSAAIAIVVVSTA
ncbi:MAG: hypothetical protein NT062_26290, partial [Proteobacteria bacterium]|nr:hypothetical protein [Pseudomonadota bacterium]